MSGMFSEWIITGMFTGNLSAKKKGLDAVANFNIGQKASVLVFERLEMIPGHYTLRGCNRNNAKRLIHSKYKVKPKKQQAAKNHSRPQEKQEGHSRSRRKPYL